jgi:transcriptional regulator with XRE-family HTH domain
MAKAWHGIARDMKRNGCSLQEIADAFGVGRLYASKITKGIPSSYVCKPVKGKYARAFTKSADGHKAGLLKRVSIGFTDKQLAFLNTEAERLGKSFSATVSDIIERSQRNI